MTGGEIIALAIILAVFFFVIFFSVLEYLQKKTIIAAEVAMTSIDHVISIINDLKPEIYTNGQYQVGYKSGYYDCKNDLIKELKLEVEKLREFESI